MAEKEKEFLNTMKFEGIFPFKDFYRFCYDWLKDETGLLLSEDKYKEKLIGDSKNIEIKWMGIRDLSDYFRYEIEVEFKVLGLTNIEITSEGRKIKTNKGSVEVKVKGTLVRDPKGRFEKHPLIRFLRGIYEKMVISSRIEEMKERIIKDCDEFLSQAKAFLDLEGKR